MKHKRIQFPSLVACLFVLFCPLLEAGETADVEALLKRRVIDPERPLQEVQAYTESRVPRMPDVSTVAEWEQHAKRMRKETLDRVVFRGEAAKWREIETTVEWSDVIETEHGYRIRKLRYEAVPGMWIPALLYEPDELKGKVPVVLNVNGHDRGDGKAAKYKQIRCINQAKRGMLALNVEWVGMGQLGTPGFTHYKMNQIDLCGTSGLSPFYLSMKRGLDILLQHEHADPQRVAVAGLSGGGWQTIFISALDERVTLSNPVAGYSSFRTRARHFSDLGDSEQTPVDLATTADYAQLTAMRAPRPTLLTHNAEDKCCFRAEHALPPLVDAARPIFRLYGKENALRTHVNHDPGSHNFEKDNREALYRMLGDFFYTNDQNFDAAEIPSDEEVKSKDELKVDVPEDNDDFHTVALRLMKDLPKGPGVPDAEEEAAAWRTKQRKALADVVRAHDWPVHAVVENVKSSGDVTAIYRWLRIDGEFTVPSVELSRGVKGEKTVLLVADGGKATVTVEAKKLLEAGNRVIAFDPFFFGESKITQRDFLFALLVSAVGDRPLGVQASQTAAIARWASEEFNGQVQVVAVGPRSSLYALTAAALEEDAINGVTVHNSYGSLKQVIEEDLAVNEFPELFCFGLLEQFDIDRIASLVEPRRVEFRGLSDRAKQALPARFVQGD